MALWGNTNGCGYFIIDENENDSTSRFAVYHHEINDGDPPSSIPGSADNARCLFQIKEVGSSDGIGKMTLGDASSPAFEVNWSTNEIAFEGDWLLSHSNSAESYIKIVANTDLKLLFEGNEQTDGELWLNRANQGTPDFKLDGTGKGTFNRDVLIKDTLTVEDTIDGTHAVFIDRYNSASAPSHLVLEDTEGTKWYFWVGWDSTNSKAHLRVHTSEPRYSYQDDDGEELLEWPE